MAPEPDPQASPPGARAAEGAVVEIRVEEACNLVRTRFVGHPTRRDLEAGVGRIRAALALLKPGFTVLADWSQIEGMDLDSVPAIAEIMEMARTHGAALIVRVLPESSRDIGLNILSATRLRGSVRTVTAENREEAERLIRQP